MNDEGKKLYEVSFLAKSENGAAVMVGHLTQFGAEILSEGNVRKIQLAYPIKKHESAFFGFINCKMPADAISKVTDSVKLDEEIIRMLIVEAEVAREKAPDKRERRAPYEPTPSVAKDRASRKEISDEGRISNELLEEKLEEILQ